MPDNQITPDEIKSLLWPSGPVTPDEIRTITPEDVSAFRSNPEEAAKLIGPIEASSVAGDLTKSIPFVGSAVDAMKAIDLYISAKKVEGGSGDESDIWKLIQNHEDEKERQLRGTTAGHDIASIIAQLPAFAGELAATAGGFNAVKSTIASATEKALAKAAGKTAANIAGKVAGTVAGSLVQAPAASMPKIVGGAAERLTPQLQELQGENSYILHGSPETVTSAIAKSFGNEFVEVFSEHTGGAFDPIKKFLGEKTGLTKFKSAVLDRFFKENPAYSASDLAKTINKFGEAAAWNGIISEMGEERIGEILRPLLGIEDEYKAPSLRQLGVEAAAFSIPGAAKTALKTMYRGAKEVAAPQQVQQQQPIPPVIQQQQPATPQGEIITADEVRKYATGKDLEDAVNQIRSGIKAKAETAAELTGAMDQVRRSIISRDATAESISSMPPEQFYELGPQLMRRSGEIGNQNSTPEGIAFINQQLEKAKQQSAAAIQAIETDGGKSLQLAAPIEQFWNEALKVATKERDADVAAGRKKQEKIQREIPAAPEMTAPLEGQPYDMSRWASVNDATSGAATAEDAQSAETPIDQAIRTTRAIKTGASNLSRLYSDATSRRRDALLVATGKLRAQAQAKGGETANEKEKGKEEVLKAQEAATVATPVAVATPPAQAQEPELKPSPDAVHGILSLNQPKVPVKIKYDPGMSKEGVREVKDFEAVVSLGKTGTNKGKLLIQIRTSAGSEPRTVWSAQVSDLIKGKILVGKSLDLDRLYASKSLKKVEGKKDNFAAYKLPTEKMERAEGASVDSVVEEAKKINEFFGAIMESLQAQSVLTYDKMKKIASSGKGSMEYASKSAKGLAVQIYSTLEKWIASEIHQLREDTTVSGKANKARLESYIERLESEEPMFSQGDVDIAAALIGSSGVFAEESWLEDAVDSKGNRIFVKSTTEDSEGNDVDLTEHVGAYDPARVDGLLGRVEDIAPKLYQSFEADPYDDNAWVKIEAELVKFFKANGKLVNEKLSPEVEAELLAKEIREKRANGWMAQPGEVVRPKIAGETISRVKGKAEIQKLLSRADTGINPSLRAVALNLVKRIPERYLSDLTLGIGEGGQIEGEFIPFLSTALIAINAKDSLTGAHEISHWLATFLPEKDRSEIRKLRSKEIDKLRNNPDAAEFIAWLDSMGGSASTNDFIQFRDKDLIPTGSIPSEGIYNSPDRYYPFINDDEFFAYHVSNRAAKIEGIETLKDKALGYIRSIINAIKSWFGDRDAYFDDIIKRFERGDFDVNIRGGMMFERNRESASGNLSPITSQEEYYKYTGVDAGQEESELMRSLVIQQNSPVIGDKIEAFNALDQNVKSQLPFVSNRIEVYQRAMEGGDATVNSPVTTYAKLVNALEFEQHAQILDDDINMLTEELKSEKEMAEAYSESKAKALAIDSAVNEMIADYKSNMMAQARKDEAAGRATALEQAIKYLDMIQKSNSSIARAVEYAAERLSIEELGDGQSSTTDIINKLKEKLERDNGGRSWQEAMIKPEGGRHGVGTTEIRTAIKIMQGRQQLAREILEIKEATDPALNEFINASENQFDAEIKSINRNTLKNFLNSYYNAMTQKDKAMRVYLNHRKRMRSMVNRIDRKTKALDFVKSIIASPSFIQAKVDAAAEGFMDAAIVKSGNNAGVGIAKTYYNPNNPDESLVITGGLTKEEYEQNIENYQIISGWLEEYIKTGLDPITRARAQFELKKINEYELNSDWNPTSGKMAVGAYNMFGLLSKIVGGSSQFILSRIGGRAAMQAMHLHALYADTKRDAADARHHGRWSKSKAIIDASNEHGLTFKQWRDLVSNPIIHSYNSLGAKPYRVGDKLHTGYVVTQKDIDATKQQKTFIDSVAGSVFRVRNKLSDYFPVRTLENMFGRQYYRLQQGHTAMVMPRRFADSFYNLIESWMNVRGNRKASESVNDWASAMNSGELLDLYLSHIRSTQLYPDYVIRSKYNTAYKEIWGMMKNGQAPDSFDDVVEIIFNGQAGSDTTTQVTKDDIIKEIVLNEMNRMISKAKESPDSERPDLNPGGSIDILSANNFMNKPRGDMVAPDSAYNYSIMDNNDEGWVMSNALEVNLQRYRDGLEMVKLALKSELDKFKNDQLKKDSSRENQVAGRSWVDYNEASMLLGQIEGLLDRSSPNAIKMFIDRENKGIFRHVWSLVQQSLLGGIIVMKNNVFGGFVKLAITDAMINGQGSVMNVIPKWILRIPVTLGKSVIVPSLDIVTSFKAHKDYNKVVAALGEDTVKAIVDNPELMNNYAANVSMSALRNARLYQEALNLGVAGSYGFMDQVSQYASLYTSGGDMVLEDQTLGQKIRGSISSQLGMFGETGLLFILPRSIAPRKIEQKINWASMKAANNVIEDLNLTIRRAIKSRLENGHAISRITSQELLGDPRATDASAAYLRSIFQRAGLNLDAIIKRVSESESGELLTPKERYSFQVAFLKEVNMSSDDNRIKFKSEFGQMMASLMGYGLWANEQAALTIGRFSRNSKDMAAINRGLMVIGLTALVAMAMSKPVDDLLRRLFYAEESPIGELSTDNTAGRNAQIVWEQTAPYWPIVGSIINQLYDVRQGGNKFFNFLPTSVLSSFLQAGNEFAITGDGVTPLVRLMRQWIPNSKIFLNHIDAIEGLNDVSAASRVFRKVNDGTIEIRQSTGGVRPSPISGEVKAVINQIASTDTDWNSVNAHREEGIKTLMKSGIGRADAERRFDIAVLSRNPQSSVYGRPLMMEERNRQIQRMNPRQVDLVNRVENSFDNYANHVGMKQRPLVSEGRKPRSSRRTTGRITRPSFAIRSRTRRSSSSARRRQARNTRRYAN